MLKEAPYQEEDIPGATSDEVTTDLDPEVGFPDMGRVTLTKKRVPLMRQKTRAGFGALSLPTLTLVRGRAPLLTFDPEGIFRLCTAEWVPDWKVTEYVGNKN